MSATAARVVRRIVTAAVAAGGALALLGSMGLSTAYAEPTPDPTPTESVTPTPTPTSSSPEPLVEEATPTPIPSESATSPSPEPLVEEATPIPTESATSPSQAPLVEEATPPPIRTGLPSPKPSAAESQGVAALAEPVADERLYVVVLTRCAGGGSDTRVEVLLYLLNDEDLTLDYVLTDDDGITRTGTVTLTPEDSDASEDPHATLEFTGLPVGAYHIDFLTGGGEPVTVQNFEILTCLVTAVSCQQITFANPATNPTVFLGYGKVDDKDGDDQDVDLEPGERRVFRTDRGVIRWLAGTLEGGAGENFSIAYAGEDVEVSVPSDCEPGPPAAGPDDGLADTGGSANAVAGLVGGGVCWPPPAPPCCCGGGPCPRAAIAYVGHGSTGNAEVAPGLSCGLIRLRPRPFAAISPTRWRASQTPGTTLRTCMRRPAKRVYRRGETGSSRSASCLSFCLTMPLPHPGSDRTSLHVPDGSAAVCDPRISPDKATVRPMRGPALINRLRLQSHAPRRAPVLPTPGRG